MNARIRIPRFAVGLLALAAATPPALAEDAPLSYSRDVAPVFRARCEQCHRPGEVAPMSLLTYEEVRPWAKSIRKEVLDRRMPPWHADSRYGRFANDNSMTDEEIALVARWVDEGAIEGDPADLPPPARWTEGWELGEPDLVLLPEVAFEVPATEENEDLYQCIVIPTNLEEDRWVSAFEYKIDNRRVVHHIVGFADPTGAKVLAADAKTPEPGFPCGMGRENSIGNVASLDAMLGGWGPGTPANLMPPEAGKLLKAGSHLFLQMHYYNQTGEPQIDRSGVGIHFCDAPPQARARVMAIIAPPLSFSIPAGEPRATHENFWRVPKDVLVYSIAPHMHGLGKEMTLAAVSPTGEEEILLSVPRYDFNWQRTYRFVEPKRVPRGWKIRMTSVHDNSAENPNNPHSPPIDVTWGESTGEEMAIGFVGYWFADEDLRSGEGGAAGSGN